MSGKAKSLANQRERAGALENADKIIPERTRSQVDVFHTVPALLRLSAKTISQMMKTQDPEVRPLFYPLSDSVFSESSVTPPPSRGKLSRPSSSTIIHSPKLTDKNENMYLPSIDGKKLRVLPVRKTSPKSYFDLQLINDGILENTTGNLFPELKSARKDALEEQNIHKKEQRTRRNRKPNTKNDEAKRLHFERRKTQAVEKKINVLKSWIVPPTLRKDVVRTRNKA